MARTRTQEEKRAVWRKRYYKRRQKLLTPEQNRFQKSLANGAPIHQALSVAYPEITTQKQAERKLEKLKKNPLISTQIIISQAQYTERLQEIIGKHPLDFIAKEEVDIVKSYRDAPLKHRAKSQPTIDSMKRSMGLDVKKTEGKHLHVHLNAIKSEEEKKDLMRILEAQKIEDASPAPENQSEPED